MLAVLYLQIQSIGPISYDHQRLLVDISSPLPVQVSVLEILEIKDKLTMGEIMSLQDGITKEEVVAIASQVSD